MAQPRSLTASRRAAAAPRSGGAVAAVARARWARLSVRAEQAAPRLLPGLARRGNASPAPSPTHAPLQAALARPAAVAAAAGAFAALAAAVFGPLRPLAGLDAAAHAWVAAHTTPEWRLDVGEHVISDGPIAAALALGWLAPSAAALAAAPRRAVLPLAAAWLGYALGAGAGNPLDGSDPPLVHALKAGFARVRPSLEIHQTFSFPSGHTTAATFTVGVGLLVLLPLAVRLATGRRGWRLPDGVALPLWAGASATTAAGRVAADAHWVTDTLAGAALAVACVAGVVCAVEWLAALEAAASDGAGGGEADADARRPPPELQQAEQRRSEQV
jgi:membrane-associated phospholipid phosphatase